MKTYRVHLEDGTTREIEADTVSQGTGNLVFYQTRTKEIESSEVVATFNWTKWKFVESVEEPPPP